MLTTSSSIAAWAVWEKHQLIWGALIALSQIVTILKPYFLFPRYIKTFHEKRIKWQAISMDYEELWFDFNRNTISEKKAKIKFFNLKKSSLSFDQVPSDIIFFDFKKHQKHAEQLCNIYMTKN